MNVHVNALPTLFNSIFLLFLVISYTCSLHRLENPQQFHTNMFQKQQVSHNITLQLLHLP